MKSSLFTSIALVFLLTLTCCSAAQFQPTPIPVPTETPRANMENPASVYCKQKGNKLEIRTAADGSQSGVCIFPDGSECDEWAYFRGECNPGNASGTVPAPTGGASSPQPSTLSRVEEITFQSGSFGIAGDLRLPAGIDPFPVVLFVHGSGTADRIYFGEYLPIMERMLRAGYATFAWDKPGTGESTGTIESNSLIQQRAQIILDAIEVLKAHTDIDKGQIDLWGGKPGRLCDALRPLEE